jgi:hypothetical protein
VNEPSSENERAGDYLPANRGREAGSRAQAETMGFVLILGLSLAVVTVSVALGSAVIDDASADAQVASVKNSMAHVSSRMSLVALGESDRQRFDLGQLPDGSVTVREDSGELTLTYARPNEPNTVFYDRSLGAVAYTSESREIAYQGGGVWRKRGANSTMVSPPEYHYHGNTLTLPIVNVTGEGGVSGRVTGVVSSVGEPTRVDPGVANPLINGTIVVEIQSDYYQGWYQFLNQRAEGSTEIYHHNRTVISELVVPQEVQLDQAIAISPQSQYSPPNGNAAQVADPVQATVPSADPIVDQKVSDANSSHDSLGAGCSVSGGVLSGAPCTLDDGTYYFDGDLALGSDVVFDTSAGNVTFVVDGSFDLSGHDVVVADASDNGVTYYVNGSIETDANTHVYTSHTPEPESRRNTFFVSGNALAEDSGNAGELDAVIYAPDATVDLQGGGNTRIRGALVANSLEVQGGGNIVIGYDDALDDASISVTRSTNQITYLHVSENRVLVELD